MQEFVAGHTGQIVFGVFAIIIILIVLGIAAAMRGNKRRSEAIREWAFRSGYNFTPGPMPATELAPISQFEVKGETVEANARNVASASRLTLFDFDHATRHQSGVMNNRTEYNRRTTSCALFKLEEPLPRFSFSAIAAADPTSLQGKIMSATVGLAKFTGAQTGNVIPIADRPGFLLATDDDAARVKPLFDSAHFFDDKCGWDVQSDGSWMLLTCNPLIYQHGWDRSSMVAMKNWDEFVNVARQIHDHFRTARSELRIKNFE